MKEEFRFLGRISPKRIQLINRLKGKFKQNYKLGPTIGKGGFSKVYSAFKLNTRIYSLVILKSIN